MSYYGGVLPVSFGFYPMDYPATNYDYWEIHRLTWEIPR
jgi:hypothetical protein